MEYLKNLDIPEGGNPELAQKMLEQIRIFQHERLVHLIVTMSVAVFMMAAFLSWFVSPNLGSAVFTLILMALLAAYLRHYYILENTIQAMYSAIAIYVSSKVIDAILQGADYAKVIYVITGKGEEIADILLNVTDRGVTKHEASGAYTGDSKTVLTCVVRRGGVTAALNAIKKNDPNAFAYVVSATEVHGEGFKSFS